MFCYVALGMKRSRGHNPCNHNDANKLLKSIKHYSTFILREMWGKIYNFRIFLYICKFFANGKKRFYCENNRCYYYFCCSVSCFYSCGHKNIHTFFVLVSFTSNTMSRTYFSQYWVVKLTFNEVSCFLQKYKKLKERTYDLIKENKVIFRLLPFNGIASRTCQKSTVFASSRPPKWI